MTTAEITAFVMALSPKEIRRRAAEDVMGWTIEEKEHSWREDRTINVYRCRMYVGPNIKGPEVKCWHPDIDRNQSRMVTDKVITLHGEEVRRLFDEVEGIRLMFWWKRTPDQETRAALIAHYTHKGGIA